MFYPFTVRWASQQATGTHSAEWYARNKAKKEERVDDFYAQGGQQFWVLGNHVVGATQETGFGFGAAPSEDSESDVEL